MEDRSVGLMMEQSARNSSSWRISLVEHGEKGVSALTALIVLIERLVIAVEVIVCAKVGYPSWYG